MDIQAELANREMGKIPVSIGTSLALEGAAGILDEAPVSPAPVLSVREVWFNLKTLFRNLYGCLEKEVRDSVTPEFLLPVLQEELGHIRAAISQMSGGSVKTVFYYPTYESLRRRFPKAVLKKPNTELQKMYVMLENQTLNGLINSSNIEEDGYSIQIFDVELLGVHPKSFIVTHIPVDLLSVRNFDDLLLLESHTGAIKTKHQWNSKLTGGKDLTNIPFNRITMQIFGDGNTQFSSMPIKIRREILKIAEENNWSIVTTKDKIIYSLRRNRNPELEKLVVGLM